MTPKLIPSLVWRVCWTFGNDVKYRDYKTEKGACKCEDFLLDKGADVQKFQIKTEDSDFRGEWYRAGFNAVIKKGVEA